MSKQQMNKNRFNIYQWMENKTYPYICFFIKPYHSQMPTRKLFLITLSISSVPWSVFQSFSQVIVDRVSQVLLGWES